MKTQSIDFITRSFNALAKVLTVFLILKINKNLLDDIYFFSVFSIFIYKICSLSEINNFRRLVRENLYKKITNIYFFVSLFRFLIFFTIFKVFILIFGFNFEFYPILLFAFVSLFLNYYGFSYVINSQQVLGASLILIGSINLLISVLITYLISESEIFYICLFYFILNFICYYFVYFFSEKKKLYSVLNFKRIFIYIIKKNKKYLNQVKRSFFSLANLSLATMIAFYLSEYDKMDIDIKNFLVILLFFSNHFLVLLDTFIKFPNSVNIIKGSFNNIYKNKVYIFIILSFLAYITNLYVFEFYLEITTIIFSMIIWICFSFLISLQDFYIQARTVKFNYIISFFILLIINILVLNIFYEQFIFIPLLIILPKLTLFLINQFFFKET